MNKKFIFVISENLINMNIFGDLKSQDDIRIITANNTMELGKITKLIKRSAFSRKIKLLPISVMMNEILGIKYRTTENYYLIIDSGALRIYPYNFFEKLKSVDNIHLELLLLNSMHAASPNIIDFREDILSGCWDDVFTYDRFDAEKYGWNYFGLNYFSSPPAVNNPNPISDVYFVGGLKGNREKLILEVFKKLFENGVECAFDLYCYTNEQYKTRQYGSNIDYYREWKRYDEIQKSIVSTNCIIEILQEGQQTQSVRYFESIYYNKKLLTNNPNVVNLPFYNPQYMKYFTIPEDIDVDWVRKRETINYNYKGEFSTLKLYEQIKNTLS